MYRGRTSLRISEPDLGWEKLKGDRNWDGFLLGICVEAGKFGGLLLSSLAGGFLFLFRFGS